MRAFLIAFVIACGSKPAPQQPEPVSAELSPALAPLQWWLGDWDSAQGSEHWVAANGAVYGIALQDAGFEVMVVDDGEGRAKADGKLRFYAMPGGTKSVEFEKRALDNAAITFANDAHDYPKTITYSRAGDDLTAVIAGGDKSDRYSFKRIRSPRAPELEAADIAFAKDTAARGVEGWVAAFDAKGGMMTKKGRIEGHDAIRELMAPLFEKTKVVWEPVASAARGDLGYTVGKAVFTNPDESWRSSYVTIWKKQADGTWKALFDTGRMVNE